MALYSQDKEHTCFKCGYNLFTEVKTFMIVNDQKIPYQRLLVCQKCGAKTPYPKNIE